MTYKDLELIIVGTGPQEAYLKELAKDLEDVRFYAPMPYESLTELMKSSWIFVLPSIREGQGIVLLEAMAAGTPPIAIQAEGSAVSDVIANNHNGLLVSPGEIEGGIKKLLTDDDLYDHLQRTGLEFVKGYDWATIAERTEEVYEKIGGAQ
jgi:glycosyltransferase involved in cell wall biosynthesis